MASTTVAIISVKNSNQHRRLHASVNCACENVVVLVTGRQVRSTRIVWKRTSWIKGPRRDEREKSEGRGGEMTREHTKAMEARGMVRLLVKHFLLFT